MLSKTCSKISCPYNQHFWSFCSLHLWILLGSLYYDSDRHRLEELSLMNPYLPILVIFLFALLLGLIISAISSLLGTKNTSLIKEIFKCGAPQVNQRERMSVQFYLTAILFILFDIETIFLYLWTKSFRSLEWFGSVKIQILMPIFIGEPVCGLEHGALKWN